LDVASAAGVSKSLVSMVIRGDDRVSPERKQAVLDAIVELDYRPNAMARGLVQRRTRVVGLVVSDLRNPFLGAVVTGIHEQASRLGYKVLISTGERRVDLEEEAIESFLELRVDGLILATSQVDDAAIVRAAGTVPVVVLNRETSDAASDSITNDNLMGAELAIEHLHSLGHRRIAHVDGGGSAAAQARREGYQRAMVRLGLANEVRTVDGGFTEDGGYRGARAILARRPLATAIFAANDLCAIGVLNAIEEAGLGIPQDVSLVGYDNTTLAALRHVSLTTIHQPGEDMGRRAMARLIERIHEGRTEPRHDIVSPSLVVRATTGPPRPETASQAELIPTVSASQTSNTLEEGG
jgi:DNA-binding LacI/PurR family transcriptional regulator